MADQVWRLDVRSTLDAQEIINSYHVRSVSALTDTEVRTFVTGIVEKFLARQSTAVTFNDVNARRVDITGTAGRIVIPTGWPKTGAVTADCLPGVMGVLIKGTSIDGQKPGHIRKFLAGIAEAETTIGRIASGSVAGWNTAVSNAQAYLDAATVPIWVCVKYTAGADPVVDAFNNVYSLSLSTVLAVQRRRKIGVGR